MRKICSALVALLLLVSGTAYAKDLDFRGLRPKTAEMPQYGYVSPGIQLTIGFPLIPYMGVSNLLSFGDVPVMFDALSKLRMPEDGDLFTRLYGFIDNVNSLYNKKVNLQGLVLPLRILGIKHKWFEVTVDGGVVNSTTSKIHGLENKLSSSNILLDEFWTPYLKTDKQVVAEVRSRTLFGGDIWGIGKLPLTIRGYGLTVLAGIGTTLGYRYDYYYKAYLEEEVTVSSGFTDETKIKEGFVWAIHGMVGAQFDIPKYLNTRVVFQLRGRPHLPGEKADLTPDCSIGMDMKIWKVASLRAEVLDFRNPEYKVEVSRKFGLNSEVAIGGLFRSEIFGDALAYATIGLGGRPVKVTATVLTDGAKVGLLFGVNVGYFPQ